MKRACEMALLLSAIALSGGPTTAADARSSGTTCCTRCLGIYGVPDCWCPNDYCRKPLPAPPPCPPCPANCCVEGCRRGSIGCSPINGNGQYICAPTNPVLDFRTACHLMP